MTRTKAALAAVVVAAGIAGFAGVGDAGTKPKTHPSQERPAPPPRIAGPAANAVPDEFGNLPTDFVQMGKDLGLSGEKLDAFVARSEKAREHQRDVARAKMAKGEDPIAPGPPTK